MEEERPPENYVKDEYARIAIARVKKRDKAAMVLLGSKRKTPYLGRRCTVTRGNFELYDLIDRS